MSHHTTPATHAAVHDLYIDGQWVAGQGSIANLNPSDTRDVIGHYAQASVDQVADAIQAAKRGQAQWAQSGLEQRYSVLMAIGDELIARKAELGELLAREEGKTLAEVIDAGLEKVVKFEAQGAHIAVTCDLKVNIVLLPGAWVLRGADAAVEVLAVDHQWVAFSPAPALFTAL